jgi:negative regulator of flagellin synthesis FlgM
MIISRAQVQGILKTYGNGPANSAKKASSVDKSKGIDNLQMSEQGKLFQTALNAIKNTPDVREEKVAEIKEAIKTNTYNVSGSEIAEKIIVRSIVDELV